jgi:hypothetical protein
MDPAIEKLFAEKLSVYEKKRSHQHKNRPSPLPGYRPDQTGR